MVVPVSPMEYADVVTVLSAPSVTTHVREEPTVGTAKRRVSVPRQPSVFLIQGSVCAQDMPHRKLTVKQNSTHPVDLLL